MDGRSFAERAADGTASFVGSWTFIILQSIIVIGWIVGNIYLLFHFDPAPFILLNLVFSTQAAYATPVIMMSQNRAADRDRKNAEEDYKTNRDAEKRIEDLQSHLHSIEDDKLDKILEILRHSQKK